MNRVVKASKTSGYAILSLALGIFSFLGILSLFFMSFGFWAAIPAVICGHIARSNIGQSEETLKGSGMAKAGLILGYFGVVVAIIGIIIVMSIPSRRDMAICGGVVSDAHYIAAAIGDYFADPQHTDINIKPSDLEGLEHIQNPWTITVNGDVILIQVVDTTGTCPLENQEPFPEWKGNVYTLKMD